jgi:hypothetical protein
MTLCQFKKDCPFGMKLHDRPCCGRYKYKMCGKGCTLGVLFENSVNVYFEWLTEDGTPVTYGPDIRYKAWPKHEVARLIRKGIWEAEAAEPAVAA